MLVVVSINELENYVKELKTRLATLRDNYIRNTLSYLEMREYSNLSQKIAETEAVIWYQSNIGNLKGFINRLPISPDVRTLRKAYILYNSYLVQLNKPSGQNNIIPGLNAKYPVDNEKK